MWENDCKVFAPLSSSISYFLRPLRILSPCLPQRLVEGTVNIYFVDESTRFAHQRGHFISTRLVVVSLGGEPTRFNRSNTYLRRAKVHKSLRAQGTYCTTLRRSFATSFTTPLEIPDSRSCSRSFTSVINGDAVPSAIHPYGPQSISAISPLLRSSP